MAFTEAKQFETIMGDRIVGCYKLKGDGSDTTWDAPVSAVEGAWFQRLDDTETSELLSWSGATITFGAAPASGKYIYIFYIGY